MGKICLTDERNLYKEIPYLIENIIYLHLVSLPENKLDSHDYKKFH